MAGRALGENGERWCGSVDQSERPTRVVDKPWVRAYRSDPEPIDGDLVGKWLVFVPVRYVDHYWTIVKQAVETGHLGPEAKVATGAPNHHATDPTRRPIVIYTNDWRDHTDVRRVLQALRQLGISWRLTYKTDADTLAGVYGRGAATYVSASGSTDFTIPRARRTSVKPSQPKGS